ncbi:FAD-dependent oxidoreductase [Oleiagrimonas sp.]|jgi:monoamine oxidase|uniref:flavin monoamine oxidase family protein n=1 Tax=Oleiagrimonas sp. TaxID=2010330 RepID=UPI00262982AF|nr:FAD-dependent oxidoreductase [Oleiagrimonas sp.]MDA3912833.1 FAD-dependent oxidoreductase [Oleiagrimonas sp.]
MLPATVVIGAGLSGLYAARLLEQGDHDVLLLEARERVGGRILSLSADDGVHAYDMGPSWLWPAMNPRAARLIEALAATLYPQHVDGGAVMEEASGRVQRLQRTWATEPASMRVYGGIGALTHALRDSLQRTSIRLGTRVTSLRLLGADTVEVTLESGETVRTARVISTLPPRLLVDTLSWMPALPADWQAARRATPTWMAGQAKFLAIYDHAFWRANGLSGMAMSQRGPLVEIHDASDADGKHAALFGFVGVAHDGRRQLGRDQLVRLALAQLTRLFGSRASTPQTVHLKDWADASCTAVPADAIPPPGHPSYPQASLPAPWSGCVQLAGSEFAGDFAGYLEGALDAAERAVLMA